MQFLMNLRKLRREWSYETSNNKIVFAIMSFSIPYLYLTNRDVENL